MPAKIEYQPNQIINNLTFLCEIEPYIYSGKIVRKARFKCHCGKEFETIIADAKTRKANSCGCNRIKHGFRQHALYDTWIKMKDRCNNSNSKNYKYYGERGISVCEEWNMSINTFLNWSIANGWEKGLQIDRIDNNKNYTPDNCRWVTIATNSQNRRTTKLNWDFVNEIRNIKLLIPEIKQKELAIAYSISPRIISDVLNNKTWKDI